MFIFKAGVFNMNGDLGWRSSFSCFFYLNWRLKLLWLQKRNFNQQGAKQRNFHSRTLNSHFEEKAVFARKSFIFIRGVFLGNTASNLLNLINYRTLTSNSIFFKLIRELIDKAGEKLLFIHQVWRNWGIKTLNLIE